MGNMSQIRQLALSTRVTQCSRKMSWREILGNRFM